MIKTKKLMLAVAASLGLASTALHAQDSGPLIDKLVQKGILNDQEAEDLRADLVKDFQTTSAGKLNISSSVTELKLSGDARYRWQYDDAQGQFSSKSNVSQRSRNRFRLRLNADVRFTDNFFGGIALETGQASDSGNQTVDPAFVDSNIYIARVFLGLNISDWGTVIIGKQKNPFYTTDLVWDADIQPYGLTESIAFHKLFGSHDSPAPASSGYSKDGKTAATYTTASENAGPDWGGFELSLIGGQFVYNTDNTTFSSTNEAESDGDASNDVYLFVQQLVASYKFDSKTSITVAPGFMVANAGDLSGANNERPFSDALVVPKGTSIPSSGSIANVSGESRYLSVVTAPGEFKFALGSLNTRFYWDFAYNIDGEDRYTNIYGLGYTVTKLSPFGGVVTNPVTGAPVQYDPVTGAAMADGYVPRAHDDRDDLAWLVGLEVGQGKGKGAWTAFVNYRETGITSVDPNLNDSDFALGYLNTRGFKFGGTYGFTDFLTGAITAYVTYNLDDNLYGGQATGGASLANRNAVNTVQVDLTWKF